MIGVIGHGERIEICPTKRQAVRHGSLFNDIAYGDRFAFDGNDLLKHRCVSAINL